MKIITARFPSKCRDCREPVEAGERVFWAKGQGVEHIDCNSASNSALHQDVAAMANREYAAGVADAETYLFNRDTFGEDFAAAEELAWMFKTGEGL